METTTGFFRALATRIATEPIPDPAACTTKAVQQELPKKKARKDALLREQLALDDPRGLRVAAAHVAASRIRSSPAGPTSRATGRAVAPRPAAAATGAGD